MTIGSLSGGFPSAVTPAVLLSSITFSDAGASLPSFSVTAFVQADSTAVAASARHRSALFPSVVVIRQMFLPFLFVSKFQYTQYFTTAENKCQGFLRHSRIFVGANVKKLLTRRLNCSVPTILIMTNSAPSKKRHLPFSLSGSLRGTFVFVLFLTKNALSHIYILFRA